MNSSSTAKAAVRTALFQQLTAAALVLAAAALAEQARAQTEPSSPPGTSVATVSASPSTPSTPATPRTKRKYTPEEIDRAFSFIDGNRDGKISREEAAGFRGVAKYFDRADTSKDNALSAEEFRSAMNHP